MAEVQLQGKRIAFVQAAWHKEIVDQCKNAFVETVVEQGIAADQIDFFEVPGSLEIPLLVKRLAKSGHYVAIAASGFVVDGGIYRHDYVAHAVIDGMMQVQLETEVPVLSAVLTPKKVQNSDEQHKFFFEHFAVKGRELGEACVQTIQLHAAIDA